MIRVRTCASGVLTSILLAIAGCGDAISTVNAALTLSFDVEAQTCQASVLVDRYRIVGLNATGQSIYGPNETPKFKEKTLLDVPETVVRVQVTLLIGTTPLAVFAAPVDLSPGNAIVDFTTTGCTPVDTLAKIMLSPASGTVAVQGVQDFHATATFSDRSMHDISAVVAWHSSNPSVAVIDAHGRAKGLILGTTDVTASFGLVTSAPAALTVTPSSVYLPMIASIKPAAGPTFGGTIVIIAGSNLTGATSVGFGAVQVAKFTVDNDSQITATSPSSTAGQVHIEVSSPLGVGAMSLVLADVLPHTVALGTPARHSGVNRVGLLRVGVDEKRVAMLETALRLLARGESLDTLDSSELDDLRAALRSPSMRGISPSRGG